MSENIQLFPPVAKKIPQELTIHNHTRIDQYFWLNQRENPEVIKYLEEENNYTREILKDTEALQNKIYNEIITRIKKDDMSVPYKKKGYYYFTRYEEDKEYPIYCRKYHSLENPEEILLNVNLLAEGKKYYDVVGLSLSPDHQYLAFGIDEIGRRNYTIFLKNLHTGIISQTDIINSTGIVTWANDSKTVFFTVKDSETLRPSKIFRKVLFTSQVPVLIYKEKNNTFTTSIYKSKSEKYIIIGSHSTLSDEYQILEADNPNGVFRIFQPREPNLEYSISHINSKFYIKTNYNAENFRVMETPENMTFKENWKEVLPHRPEVLVEGIDLFNDFLVVSERVNAQQKIRIIGLKDFSDHYIAIEEDAYTLYTSVNPELETSVLRFNYQSMSTPLSVFDYNMISHEKVLMKQQEIPGGFNSSDYITKRFFAKAIDGEEIPISLVFHKDTVLDAKNPLLLYAYGSYGHTIDPYFSISRLSLLNRGFIYAIAHVRGSEIKGRRWYEAGKMLNKKNTFTDFIDSARYLIDKKYTSANHLYAMGGSAGGLLMGSIANMNPELFHGIIAAVPFVDVVTTMLDESIPLTTGEYDEWGNPNIKEYYNYMLSYSPYDNVKAQKYPAMLVTSGLHDSQVQYWEPAKWVAKLRELKTDENLLLLNTDMESGHSGTTGRYQYYKDTALEFAFLLKLESIRE